MRRIAAIPAAIALVAAALVLTAGCDLSAPLAQTGSGTMQTKDMAEADFDKLDVGHAFQVEVKQGDEYEVSVTVDDNLWDLVDVGVDEDTLRIRLTPNARVNDATLKAVVTMPGLEELRLSGSSDAQVSGFTSADPLAFDLSGDSTADTDALRAGSVRMDLSGSSAITGFLDATECDMKLSGGSEVGLEGSAEDALVDASGGSNVGLGRFTVTDAEVTLSGASEATVEAGGTIDADLSGGSTLYYSGEGQLGDVNTSGDSQVKKR